MPTQAQFWNKIARKYAARPVGDPDAYAQTLDRVRDYLTPSDQVLELGCGTASTAITLSPHVARYVASDYAQDMLDIGAEKIEAEGISNIDLLCTTELAPDLPDAGFDAVMGFNLYHLIEDLDGALAAAYRLVKPGGVFISKSTCLGRFSPFRPIVAVMRAVGKAPYVRFMSIADLDGAVERAGFQIVETGNYPAKPPARFIVARKPSP
ncbi:methyltransferase-like protein [Actibacterium atlanticum]|uniref:Methyltransferase-like protein n=1 Tax=Actibacterium atlanticum TaxID=1461693 RepID=A0A058ZIH9_9RHOB|nr:class I SAM-dependent methyltransferase [Actibacterium atlanticum]KCV81030.1 methyltransferase-like protein [Actibacterium atlanticum]